MGGLQSRDARTCNTLCCRPAEDESTNLLEGALVPVVAEEVVNGVDRAAYSVIQFSSSVFFCGEEEGECAVDIIRLGDTTGEALISYQTVDATATAGRKYVAANGRIHFGVGESRKQINIKVLQDDIWDATLEFIIKLSDVRGATLGTYLKTCRVMIIDDDFFPTNKYQDVFEKAESIEEVDIPSMSLMTEYVKLNMANSEIKRKTIKTMLSDQVKNVYFFLTIYLQMYLIDVVLAPHGEREGGGASEGEHEATERRLLLRSITAVGRLLAEGAEGEEEEGSLAFDELIIKHSRKYTALVVGLLYILPFGLMHFIDSQKIKYGLNGIARKSMQANLLRKFLNYKEENRQSMSTGDITMAMVRDCKEVVDFGFMKIIEVVRIVGKLMLALVFILTENGRAIIPLLTYPFIMGAFLWVREARTIKTNEDMAEAENSVVMSINDAVTNYRLLADFDLRSFMVDSHEVQITDFNKCEIDANLVNMNNKYLPPFLITLLIGVHFILSTSLVSTCGGSLSLGAFIATINVFKEIGVELSEIYEELMEIQKASGPLKKVCHYMNKETNLRQRMKVSRMRLERGEQLRQELRDAQRPAQVDDSTTGAFGSFCADQVPILVKDVCFSYPGIRSSCFTSLNGSFKQGHVYAFVGPPHEGKATFMRLLGQVIQLDDTTTSGGYIFIPPHLRVLHLSQDVFLLHHDLLTNLVFNQEPSMYGGVERIQRICRKLHFSKQISDAVENLNDPDRISNFWRASMSHTDMARLNLARAFILNPEFMVLQKPALSFDEEEREMCMALLREHVDEKGMEMPKDSKHLRRPRTVCFTSSSTAGINMSDVVYEVSAAGLKSMKKTEALGSWTGSSSRV